MAGYSIEAFPSDSLAAYILHAQHKMYAQHKHLYRELPVYLSSRAIDDKARDNTLPRLAFKHAGSTVNVVAKVNAGHGYCVHYQAAFRCLKGICVMEGEEGSGLEDRMRLAACVGNKNVAVSACIGVSALVKTLESSLRGSICKACLQANLSSKLCAGTSLKLH